MINKPLPSKRKLTIGVGIILFLVLMITTITMASSYNALKEESDANYQKGIEAYSAYRWDDSINYLSKVGTSSGENYDDAVAKIQSALKYSKTVAAEAQAKAIVDAKAKADADAKAKVEADAKAKADAIAKAQADAERAEAARVGYDTGITYNQLARTPDNFKGSKVKFSGKVIQVMEGKEVQLRIAVNNNYDTILYVAYDSSITATRVLENDYVTVKGESGGIYTYQSTGSGSISIPLVLVDIIN